MSMHIVFWLRFQGAMPQETLEQLRNRLGLKRAGRLSDAEDARFGYRHLLRDQADRVDFDLWRDDETQWKLELSYAGRRPATDTIEALLADSRAVLTELGFEIIEVQRWPER